MTLEDSLDPPMFASNGADKWTRRNVERNGADPWASLTNIGVNVFFGRSPGSIVLKVEQSHRSLGVRLMESLLFVSHVQAKLEHACTWLGFSFESVVQPRHSLLRKAGSKAYIIGPQLSKTLQHLSP